ECHHGGGPVDAGGWLRGVDVGCGEQELVAEVGAAQPAAVGDDELDGCGRAVQAAGVCPQARVELIVGGCHAGSFRGCVVVTWRPAMREKSGMPRLMVAR